MKLFQTNCCAIPTSLMILICRNIAVTIQLKAVPVGTELHITQSGIVEVIPVEACYSGWQESLQLLSLLVSPEIPDR